MTSRFIILFFGSDGVVVVVVVWHPEALLFSARARRLNALSRFVFGYIKWNWKNAIEFFSNSYSSQNARRLSLPKTNDTLFWCWRRRRRLGGVCFVFVVGVVSFLIHKMRTTLTTNRNVVLMLKGVTDDARRPRQFWRRRTKRRRPSSFSPRNVTTRNNDGRGGQGRDETHYLDYPTVIKAFVQSVSFFPKESLFFHRCC